MELTTLRVTEKHSAVAKNNSSDLLRPRGWEMAWYPGQQCSNLLGHFP